jgi:excisionase family DNA binding protein
VPQDGAGLVAAWNNELRDLGFTPPTIRAPEPGLQIGRINRDVAADLVLTRLGAKRSAWNAADIRGEAERLIASVSVVAERPVRQELVEDIAAHRSAPSAIGAGAVSGHGGPASKASAGSTSPSPRPDASSPQSPSGERRCVPMAERRAVPVYLSLEEAAEAMSVSVKTIRRWIAAGTLPAYRCGKRAVRIKLEDLEAAPRQMPSARW